MTVDSPGRPLTLHLAAERLGVRIDALDAEFGVVPIDPVHGTYAVRVQADCLQEAFAAGPACAGPFSDLPIGPMGSRHEGGE